MNKISAAGWGYQGLCIITVLLFLQYIIGSLGLEETSEVCKSDPTVPADHILQCHISKDGDPTPPWAASATVQMFLRCSLKLERRCFASPREHIVLQIVRKCRCKTVLVCAIRGYVSYRGPGATFGGTRFTGKLSEPLMSPGAACCWCCPPPGLCILLIPGFHQL